jgi:hypothetical protein
MRTFCRFCTLLALALFYTVPVTAQTPPYARTSIVVSGATPAGNGTNLLAALAAITTASAANPWLLKVEPGLYDLGTSQLIAKSYVDIEGSGLGVTVLTSAAQGNGGPGATVLVNTGIKSELRELTVKNTSAGMGRGLYVVSDDFRLRRVNVDVDTVDQSVAVEIVNSSPALSEVSVQIKTGRWGATGVAFWSSNSKVEDLSVRISSSNSDAVGVSVGGTSSPSLNRIAVNLQGSLTAFGVVFGGGDPLLANCEIRVSGGSTLNTGIFAKNAGTAHVRDCFVSVQGLEARGADAQSPAILQIRGTTMSAVSSGRAWGLFNEGAQMSVASSEIRGIGTSFGVGAFNINGTSITQIDGSTLEGSTNGGINATLGDRISIRASKLIGSVPTSGVGGYTCIGAYNGAYAALSSACL